MVKKHSFELAIRKKAEDISNDIVNAKKDHDRKGKIGREARIFHGLCQAAILHRQAQLVENNEELDCNLDDVNDEAAEVHLGEGAEKDRDVDQLVDAAHHRDETVHDCQSQMHESADHKDGPMFLAFGGWRYNRFAHILPSAKC